MKSIAFPWPAVNEWRETRDTLLKYCRLLGAIRETLASPLPHSLHTNLLVCKNGFTTSTIQRNNLSPDQTFEVIIDLIHQKLRIESNYRESMYVALTGQSLNALCDETCSLLTDIGISAPLGKPSFIDGVRGRFESGALKKYWEIIRIVDKLLKSIKKDLVGETSPVMLRPDDLSLIINWYGKKTFSLNNKPVEQIEFGFSTGDENISDIYFYVTSFPETDILNRFYDRIIINKYAGNSKMAILTKDNLTDKKLPEEQILFFFNSFIPIFKPSYSQ